MKVGAMVRIVDHEGYKKILRVGEVGEVTKLEEQTVFVKFDSINDKEGEEHHYPTEVVEELTEEEQKQLGSGGKGGMPDTSRPTPPQMATDDMKLDGEQDQIAQADSPETRPQPGSSQSAGVTSDDVVSDGETPQLDGYPAGTGGTSSKERPETGSAQSAGVKGAQVVQKGEQPQMDQVPGREVVKGVKEGVNEGRVFRPLNISVLEQGDGEDEYVMIGEGSSIRNEKHLMSAVKGAIHKAMESMDRPFDSVQVVFRRDAIAEGERRDAEKKMLAVLHMLDEGKNVARQVREAAHAAAKSGVLTARYESYTSDQYARKVLNEAQAIVEMAVGGPVEIVWPPKELGKYVGDHMIIESIYGDRWVGTLQKGPGRMFQIKTRSGMHKFSPHDVNRIIRKPGAK